MPARSILVVIAGLRKQIPTDPNLIEKRPIPMTLSQREPVTAASSSPRQLRLAAIPEAPSGDTNLVHERKAHTSCVVPGASAL